MKAWLKGGLIGILFLIILLVFSIILFGYDGIIYPYSYLGFPILAIAGTITITNSCELCGNILAYVSPLIEFFIIGSIIGLVIGKIKSRA